MVEDVDTDRAVEIAKAYADEECVGKVGEIVGVDREDDTWIVASCPLWLKSPVADT